MNYISSLKKIGVALPHAVIYLLLLSPYHRIDKSVTFSVVIYSIHIFHCRVNKCILLVYRLMYDMKLHRQNFIIYPHAQLDVSDPFSLANVPGYPSSHPDIPLAQITDGFLHSRCCALFFVENSN